MSAGSALVVDLGHRSDLVHALRPLGLGLVWVLDDAAAVRLLPAMPWAVVVVQASTAPGEPLLAALRALPAGVPVVFAGPGGGEVPAGAPPSWVASPARGEDVLARCRAALG